MFGLYLIFRGIDDGYLQLSYSHSSSCWLATVGIIWMNNSTLKDFSSFSTSYSPPLSYSPLSRMFLNLIFFCISGNTLESSCSQNNLKRPPHGAKHFCQFMLKITVCLSLMSRKRWNHMFFACYYCINFPAFLQCCWHSKNLFVQLVLMIMPISFLLYSECIWGNVANILHLFYVFILIIKNVIKGHSFHVIISLGKLLASFSGLWVLSLPKKSK